MLTTKDFALLCDTSKQTILYYGQIGLLKPIAYDGRSRFYNNDQILTFQEITFLKSFGLKLSEIKKFMQNKEKLKDAFLKKQQELLRQKARTDKTLREITNYLETLEKGTKLIIPKIKTIKPHILYAMEQTGRYIDIKYYARELSERINDYDFKRLYGVIFKDEKYRPANAHFLIVATGKIKPSQTIKDIQILNIPSYKAVCYKHIGPYAYLSYIWQFLDQYIIDNNLVRDKDKPCREFYFRSKSSEPDEENYITELQIPII